MLWVIDEQLTVYRQGAPRAQAFSGSHVDFVGNEIELLLAVARQVDALGQLLAAPVLALASRHPLVVGVPKAVNQVAAQLPHGLGVNTAVDGFC